jgi:hypothetical protein
MQLTDQALDISRAHAQAAGQATSPMSTCISIMRDASAASAKFSAKRNAADGCSAAAKKCDAPAAQTIEAATTCGTMTRKIHP